MNDTEQLLHTALQCLHPIDVVVTNNSYKHSGHAGSPNTGNSHFFVRVVSHAFEGQSKIQRHRAIYAACNHLIPTPIHALEIEALTP